MVGYLAHLGIRTVGDLIDHLPYRYEDYSEIAKTTELTPGAVTIRARVVQASGRYVRRGMHITEAVLSDDAGSVRAVWFNQPYRAAALKAGQEYYVSGQYELQRQRFQIMNPSAELVKDFPVNTARIIPVYRQSKRISSTQLRKLMAQCVPLMEDLPETLPQWILDEAKLLARSDAMQSMHFPQSAERLAAAKRRLGFEEVLELSLASLLNKQENRDAHALAIAFDQEKAKHFVAHLPFVLTDDQRRAIWQIYQDMEHRYPMNRLVEGDVGSGKTVVAAMAALMAVAAGFQVVLMAPTELLARQHHETLRTLFAASSERLRIELLVGGMTATEKSTVRGRSARGQADLIIGTHAVFQQSVEMQRLGLVIVDEQHRFGVQQRKELMAKAGHMPHVLSLTATPIPRSLALTLYGELDVSLLKNKPSGRHPIQTKIISQVNRNRLYEGILGEIDAGRQVFVVCPNIAKGEADGGALGASAEEVYASLKDGVFAGQRVGLLHGQMKPADKDATMRAFAGHELDVLVSTTVVEVGVDVPNATVMVVESAERFGLAQLHQLRGRVGRGEHQAYCYLLQGDAQAPGKRLRAIESSQDGFRLAELDLEIRGPGAIYGAMQHGALDLRVARLTDTELIMAARQAAQQFIDRGENLLQYPELHERVERLRRVTNLN